MNGIEADRVENVGHLKVTIWNGEDVQYMVNQVVLKTGNQTVKGKKTFIGDWSIHGNLHVNGMHIVLNIAEFFLVRFIFIF